MTDPDERWTLVGRYIAARMEGPPAITMTELVKLSGVSDTSIRAYIAGKPIVRVGKRRDLCRGLGWTEDSIDLILNGGTPRLDLPIGTMAQFEERLTRVEAMVEELVSRKLGDAPASPPGGKGARRARPT